MTNVYALERFHTIADTLWSHFLLHYMADNMLLLAYTHCNTLLTGDKYDFFCHFVTSSLNYAYEIDYIYVHLDSKYKCKRCPYTGKWIITYQTLAHIFDEFIDI